VQAVDDEITGLHGASEGQIFINALQGGSAGCLMSDGYAVHRSYLNRIRCLAHLLRKARGLTEATCRHTSQVGQQLLDLMGGLIPATQAARDGPFDDWAERQAPALAQLKALCERHQHRLPMPPLPAISVGGGDWFDPGGC